MVSFYQIVATLGPVYGVRLHEKFTRWTDFIDAFSLDLLGLTYPDACIGSMPDRLLLAGLWPILSIMIGGATLACCALAEWLLSGRTDALRRDLVRLTLRRLLYWAILVSYLVLPSVSRSIFKARQCESFNVDDLTGDRRSYLVADLDVLCSADDDEYRGLDAYFWAFFVLWPVLVPLAFLALLLSIRSAVRALNYDPTRREATLRVQRTDGGRFGAEVEYGPFDCVVWASLDGRPSPPHEQTVRYQEAFQGRITHASALLPEELEEAAARTRV